ncbi:MAG: outer membrane lipoprotein carrier protein LolA [Candidatus Eisenbacteria bacterium]
MRATIGWALVVILPLTPVAGRAHTAEPTAASRALATRLAASGRAEAALVQVVPDPLGGPADERRGRVAIENPDRVRLDYTNGESVALRGDGGEWLQPRLQQMLVFDAAGAGAANRAWDLLLGRDDSMTVRAAGGSTWRLVPKREQIGLPDSVEVALDPAGLPRRLTAWVGGERTVEFRISGWRFLQSRGRGAFVLAAPRGFEVIRTGP